MSNFEVKKARGLRSSVMLRGVDFTVSQALETRINYKAPEA